MVFLSFVRVLEGRFFFYYVFRFSIGLYITVLYGYSDGMKSCFKEALVFERYFLYVRFVVGVEVILEVFVFRVLGGRCVYIFFLRFRLGVDVRR